MKQGASGVKAGATASPNNGYNSSKGTGLDAKASGGVNPGGMLSGQEAAKYNQNPNLLNEDSMTRLISQQNPKKSTGGVT